MFMYWRRKLARIALFFIEITYMILAIALIVLGVMMRLNVYKLMDVKEALPFLIIGLGCLIFCYALLRFFAVIRHISCISLIYTFLMLILLTLEILLICYTYNDKFVTPLEKSCEKAWKLQQEGNDGWMNVMQSDLKCCGENGTSDYTLSGKTIPESCSIQRNKSIPTIYATEGCRSAIKSLFLKDLDPIQYILIAVTALQILMFTLGCFVSCANLLEDIAMCHPCDIDLEKTRGGRFF